MSDTEVQPLIDAYLAGESDAGGLRALTKHFLSELAKRSPGRSVEIRVPPYAAIQAIAGPRHTRGTPGAVVELSPHAWLDLALGVRTWQAVAAAGELRASGERSDLSAYLPLV